MRKAKNTSHSQHEKLRNNPKTKKAVETITVANNGSMSNTLSMALSREGGSVSGAGLRLQGSTPQTNHSPLHAGHASRHVTCCSYLV